MAQSTRFLINLPRLTLHTEPIIIQTETDRRQNTDTMLRRERDRLKKINIYRQWLKRLKHYTKRKYNIDIGQLNKEETTTGTENRTE